MMFQGDCFDRCDSSALGFDRGLTSGIRCCLYVDDVYVLCMFAMYKSRLLFDDVPESQRRRGRGCSDVRRCPGDVVDKTERATQSFGLAAGLAKVNRRFTREHTHSKYLTVAGKIGCFNCSSKDLLSRLMAVVVVR